jgi:Skp family chaperone for outer membrane proteins
MKSQMEAAIKELSDQMTEASAKLEDEFTRESLSPEAEKKLQEEMQTLSSELQRYQQQYYYMLQQANMKTMNIMADKIKEASGSIAKEKHYSLIVNKEQVFHYTPDLEITDAVIIKLDDMFKTETENMEKVKSELSKKGAAK